MVYWSVETSMYMYQIVTKRHKG